MAAGPMWPATSRGTAYSRRMEGRSQQPTASRCTASIHSASPASAISRSRRAAVPGGAGRGVERPDRRDGLLQPPPDPAERGGLLLGDLVVEAAAGDGSAGRTGRWAASASLARRISKAAAVRPPSQPQSYSDRGTPTNGAQARAHARTAAPAPAVQRYRRQQRVSSGARLFKRASAAERRTAVNSRRWCAPPRRPAGRHCRRWRARP